MLSKNYMSFVHLIWHSTFSFLESIGKPGGIVSQVKSLWQNAVTITDYNGVFGAIKLYDAAHDADIKPIIGVELWFVVDHTVVIDPKHIGTLSLVATNNIWYHNILKLTSFANTHWLTWKPKIDLAILEKHKEWIIAIVWTERSWLQTMLHYSDSAEKYDEIFAKIVTILGKDNVLWILVAQKYTDCPVYQKIHPVVESLCKKYDCRMVTANDFHHVLPDQRKAREAALAIKDGKKMYENDRRKPPGLYHIMSEEEIRLIHKENWFTDEKIDVLLTTTQDVADSIDIGIELGKTLFPNYDSPEHIEKMYEKYKDILVEE